MSPVNRLLPLLALAALLPACAEEAPEPAPEPVEVVRGEFSLRNVGDVLPGQRPGVRLTGDTAGVTVTVRRALDPLVYFQVPSEYEEIARVPLVLRWPGRLPAGLRDENPRELWRQVDGRWTQDSL